MTAQGMTPGREAYGLAPEPGTNAGDLPFIKPEDYQYFGSLMKDMDESNMRPDELKERKIMKLLLKIKNGTPPQRKTALRQITDKARTLTLEP
jgi:splicing factor 3B subunit 1